MDALHGAMGAITRSDLVLAISKTGRSAESTELVSLLVDRGTAATCQLSRLAVATACSAELPVIVDGGVTEEVAPLCITAGVESMVVGRALLAQSKGIMQ